MDVSVIIVNYKTSHLIRDCVDSIIDLTKDVDYEVIIVDNNSETEFKERIEERIPSSMHEKFHFIALPENIGFGRANNEGLKKAKGRNILFLNPDTILLDNAVKILSDFLDSHDKAGGCGANLLDWEKRPTYSYRKILPGIFWDFNEIFNNYPQKLLYGKIDHYYNRKEKPVKVGYITGADLMVKSKVLEETGAFRKEYFMYFEETDLCVRIKKAGWELYSVPAAHIIHLEGQSFDEKKKMANDLKTKFLEDSRNIYYLLNHGSFTRTLSNMLYRLFLRSRVMLISEPEKKRYYQKRLEFHLNYQKGK